MSDPVRSGDTDAGAMASSLAAMAPRLHGIESRTDLAKIAAEVLRLNDAARNGSTGRLQSGDHPQDFAALLIASEDPVNRTR